MSIQVVSNEKPQVEAPEAKAQGSLAQVGQEGTNSAPDDAKAGLEQNESEDSEALESDAKEDGSDESEGSESQDEDKAQDSESEKPKKKSGIQRRVDKLNARIRAKEQEAEYWRQQALKGANDPKPEPKVDTRTAVADGKPKADDFETHSEFVEALADWKTEQKLKERDQKAAEERLKVEQSNAQKSFNEKLASFKEKHGDFNEVVSNLEDENVQSPTMVAMIVKSENGPELLYELAKNAKEAKRISMLPPLEAARELGKFESRLFASKESKPEPKKVTQAPKPLEPVGTGKGAVKKSLSDPSLSQAEYEALRREDLKRRRA